jgi:O-antigen ligase
VIGRDAPAPRAVPDWAILITGVIACLLVASRPRAAHHLPTFVFGTGVAISVIAALAVALPGPFTDGPLSWLVRQGITGRAAGSTHGPNVLGIIAAMAFVYFLIGSPVRETLREKAASLLLATACVPALYFTFSRSAALGVAVAVVLGLYLLGRRIAVVAGVAVIAAALVLFGPGLLESRLDTSSGRIGGSQDPHVVETQTNSDRLRVEAWAAGLRMVIDRPITGVGFGRYAPMRDDYGGPAELRTPHSDYIRFFAETGLPGGMAFLIFLAGVAWAVWRAEDVRRASLAAALAAFGIATQFNAQLYYLESSLPFWVAAGAAIALPASREPMRAIAAVNDVRSPGDRPAVAARE